MGGAANLEGLAVEVFGAEGKDLAQTQAGVGEGPDQGLVATGGLGEAVHFLESEDADGAALLLGSRVIGADADALERVEVADFVGDCVLGHCREGAENADGAGGSSTFGLQHVVDEDQGVAAAQLAERPVLQAMPSTSTSVKRLIRCLLVALVRSDRGCRSVQVSKYAPRVSGLSERP